MTAAFQPYQDAFAPSIDTSDVVPASPPGGEALSAESVAVPASAQVQTSGSAQRAALPSPSPALDPTGQFLRPELSGGPDSLVTALAGDHPNTNPFGFVVDPKTGAVSRWLVRTGADALQPGQTDLVPVSPQEKQSYLEWLTGARANYPLGEMSPEEQQSRRMQSLGLLSSGGPDVTSLLRQISQGEGTSDADAQARGFRSGYDTVYGYGRYGRPQGDLTGYTLSDVDRFQSQMKDAQRQEFARLGLTGKLPTSAVGKYQFTQETLRRLEHELRLSGGEKFTPELHETFARMLLNENGIQRYSRGEITSDHLQGSLHNIWSSIEAPGPASAGRKPGRGTTTQEFRNALPEVGYLKF